MIEYLTKYESELTTQRGQTLMSHASLLSAGLGRRGRVRAVSGI